MLPTRLRKAARAASTLLPCSAPFRSAIASRYAASSASVNQLRHAAMMRARAASVSHDGRASAVCGPSAGRGEDGAAVPGVEISRKTWYKIFTRYKDCRVEGLTD